MVVYNPTIYQGDTFTHVVRWEGTPIIYKPITTITQAAPAVVTCPLHGVPDGWRVGVVSVLGMTQINAANSPLKDRDYVRSTLVDSNTIQLNTVNAAGYYAYKSGGYIQYNTPIDLTGFTAAMTIKDKVGGVALSTLTSANGGLVIDIVAHTITIVITAVASAAFTWTKGVYDLEVTSGAGVITGLLSGSVTVIPEIT